MPCWHANEKVWVEKEYLEPGMLIEFLCKVRGAWRGSSCSGPAGRDSGGARAHCPSGRGRSLGGDGGLEGPGS